MPGRRTAAAIAVFGLGFAALGGSCGGSQHHPAAASGISTSTSVRPEDTTSTTVDPGTLPQTSQLPSAGDPSFRQRIADLWSAIVSGDPAAATPAFFPLSAYLQVKAIADPAHDYKTRLVADFDQDIMALHARVPASATFQSVSVPTAAQWILPGAEYNKGSYWRVYGTRVTYEVSGQTRQFTIASMISWRGEWYVVHLLAIR